MKKMNLMLPLLGSVVFAVACNAKSNEVVEKTTPKEVPVTTLIQMDTVIYKEYIADIQSQKNVELRSRLKGFLNKIHVDEGDFVQKGQVLFSLDNSEYKANLAQAKAVLENAKTEVKKVELEIERTKKLVAKKIVGETEQELLAVQLNSVFAKMREAEALVNQANTQLNFTLVRAPFDGRIDRIALKEGSLLDEGSLLTTISDFEKVNVYFNISESEYLSIASESTFNPKEFKRDVQLILANGVVYPHPGVAEIVESEFDANTGSIALRARFDNPKGLLKHGGSGRIGVPLNTGNLTFVHQKSVVEIQDKAYVYTVQNNQVKMTPFKNGQRVGHYYVVEEGLPKDALVVFEGVQSLRDGMSIQPKMINK